MNKKHVNLFIMAGGVGSRFWPKSRNSFPKQFIDVLGTGESLLQLTYNRFSKIIDVDNIYIVTNKDYYDLVHEQLPALQTENIICEPSRNNTAPCIAYAAFKSFKQDPDSIMVIVPSDHLILKENEYLKIIKDATNFVEEDNILVTLGISPTRPDTGYGYIQYEKITDRELYPVKAFHEKPQLALATQYLKDGNYLWNAGMFIWRAADILEAYKRYSPEIYELFHKGAEFYNTVKESEFILENYPKSENISIDYAIMEKAKNVYTIPSDIGWSDLGTWNSLFEVSEKNEDNNVLIANGHQKINNSSGCIINAPSGKMIVIEDLRDYIIVDNDNVLLIYPRSKEQEIKSITSALKKEGCDSFL